MTGRGARFMLFALHASLFAAGFVLAKTGDPVRALCVVWIALVVAYAAVEGRSAARL